MIKKRKDMYKDSIHFDKSLHGMDERERNDFFQEKLAAMKGDKGLPHIASIQRISSAAEVPFGRSIESAFKRFPEDQRTVSSSTVRAGPRPKCRVGSELD